MRLSLVLITSAEGPGFICVAMSGNNILVYGKPLQATLHKTNDLFFWMHFFQTSSIWISIKGALWNINVQGKFQKEQWPKTRDPSHVPAAEKQPPSPEYDKRF